MEQSDEELLITARAGDRTALEVLLLRYQSKVYGFGMRMCRNPEDAKDVLQDTLLAMARSVGDFRGNSSISTWLYAITRSFCVKKRRRGRSVSALPVSTDADHTSSAAAGVRRRAPFCSVPCGSVAPRRRRAFPSPCNDPFERSCGGSSPRILEPACRRRGRLYRASEMPTMIIWEANGPLRRAAHAG